MSSCGTCVRTFSWLALLAACGQPPAKVTMPPPDEPDASMPSPVVTNRYDASRTGATTHESVLTPASVAGGTFGLLFSRPVDGQIYAQPLYVPELTIAGVLHNVVFVATEHDSVFAFDADDPAASAPLWKVSLGTPGPLVPGKDASCADMFPEVGITSTPVIDASTRTMYLVAKSVTNGQYSQKLHALDLETGTEKLGGPVELAGGGFDAKIQLNRPGLLLADGAVYAAFASHCDDGPYHGWVFAVDATTLAIRGQYNTTPTGKQGGIWQSGMGLAHDGTGAFFVSGNGSFDATGGGAELGLSVGKLTLDGNGLSVADFWTPANAQQLNDQDTDLTSGAVLVPDSHLLLAGGKDGNLYVFDRTYLGGFQPDSNQILQTIAVGGHVHGGPVAWIGPQGTVAYVWPENSPLQAYSVGAAGLSPHPIAVSSEQAAGHPGGMTTVSSHGTQDGIIWANYATSGDAWHKLAPGQLVAFDAVTLHVLWRSDDHRERDYVGNFGKFVPPMVANGRVYLGTFSSALRVYGLGAAPAPARPYLSALTPTSTQSGFGPVELDMSNGEDAAQDGRTIAIAGVSYPMGLGMHAAANVAYDLGGRYKTFVSDVGVDDEKDGQGSVVFQVVVDGTTVFDSGLRKGGDPAVHVNVPVTGAHELRLVVLDGGDGPGADHADWAGAELIPTAP